MQFLIKPYFIRAVYDWCFDNGYMPHLEVLVSQKTIIPKRYLHDEKIIFNIGTKAINNLIIGNEKLEFQARFSGIVEFISIPITSILSIYSKDTGEGMKFNCIEKKQISMNNHVTQNNSSDRKKPEFSIIK